jgi:aminoglycoside 3-N-acetyltransferase I
MTPPELIDPDSYRVRRLGPGEVPLAKRLFSRMAEEFEEDHDELSDAYVEALLARAETWVLAALLDDEVAGGLTAHVLPMTRTECAEVFIYDIAVLAAHRRRGVGRLLVQHLQGAAGAARLGDLFVPVDNEDDHAQDFYRALGGVAAPVMFFTFAARRR